MSAVAQLEGAGELVNTGAEAFPRCRHQHLRQVTVHVNNEIISKSTNLKLLLLLLLFNNNGRLFILANLLIIMNVLLHTNTLYSNSIV